MILWKNGYFHTLIDDKHMHHQMATDNGLIVGFDDEVNDLSFDQEIDLKSLHVYPGFVDAHLHLIGYGQKLSQVTLDACISKTDTLVKIDKHVKLGVTFFEGYKPKGVDKTDLNMISDHSPIILRHSDYHSVTVNDFVLEELNLLSQTGYLTEEDAKLVIKVFNKQDKKTLKKALENSIKKLYSYGITGGHSDDLFYFNGFSETLDIFQETLNINPFRAHLLMHYMIIDEYLESNLLFLDIHKYLQLGAVKIFYDGTFTSKTALLKYNYLNESQNGLHMFTKHQLEKLIIKLRSKKLPLAIHVIGDLGLKEVIQLLKKYPPEKGLHDRIIHGSLADLETIKSMATCPIIMDIQPQFITSDLPEILNIFSKKPDYIYPFKTYLDEHITLCGSSDAPVEDPNPFKGMHAAITRQLKDGTIFQKEQCISRFEALKLYTSYANIPTYKKNRGYLKKGYIADLTMTKENILTSDLDKFVDTKVKMTVIDEKIVFNQDI
ncbi:MAG: amidohydrolase [Acholeplasmataceae bacterium]|nr:amidohydrolase [Acholeplasmataceae bacterium]